MNLFFLKQTKPSAGFTLIELLVVIAIIGILASTVLASLSSARSSARDAKRISEARSLMSALELHRNSNNGLYPCAANANPTSGNCTITGNHAGGLDNGISVISLKGTRPSDTTLRSVLKFAPTETVFDDAIVYRVQGSNNRTTYAIRVHLENKRGDSAFCRIAYSTDANIFSGYGTPKITIPSC